MNISSIMHKLKYEILKIWILSFYFTVFFIAISYFRFAILKTAQVPFTDFGLGAVKAVICAKFLLVSQAIYPIKLNNGKSMLLHILGRSLLYVLLVTILIAIEEATMAKFHGKNILDSITGLRPGSIHIFFSLAILYWLMVVPYVVFSAISQSIGVSSLRAILMGYNKPKL
ncbi:MAG: hypothetical protein EKK54_11645 [Neisseriaceae bacterium]|nr:MAG: hypothetical protein EKK54_11645 [Neisseriaceae bacterium]